MQSIFEDLKAYMELIEVSNQTHKEMIKHNNKTLAICKRRLKKLGKTS